MTFLLNSRRNASAFLLLLLLSTSFGIVTLPITKAQQTEAHGNPPGLNITGGPPPSGATWSFESSTTCYLAVSPNPIGVGQTGLVNVWTTPAPAGNRAHTGYTVVITKPDGTNVTVGPFDSFVADGTGWFSYVFDQVGLWHLQFFFAGDYYPAGVYSNGFINGTAGFNASIAGATGGAFSGVTTTYPSTYNDPGSGPVAKSYRSKRCNKFLVPIGTSN